MSVVSKLDWRPHASLETLRQRAAIIRYIREYFYHKNVLEVETPILSRFGNTDPHIESFTASGNVTSNQNSEFYYLHTSPEFAMKRLLCAGMGSIYQICKVFRHGESGRFHNSEFTMLEWYRLDLNYHQLMDEIAELLNMIFHEFKDSPLPGLQIEKITYTQAFLRHTGLDPNEVSIAGLSEFLKSKQHVVEGIEGCGREIWLDYILSEFVQPKLGCGNLTFLFDFPANRAALANTRMDNIPVAERFELFIDGVELANGYQELTDACELRNRLTYEQEIRRNNNQLGVGLDENLIAACTSGLPLCSGVALGMDRLILIILKQKSLKKVLAFCSKNA